MFIYSVLCVCVTCRIAKIKEKSRKKNHEKKQKIVESRKNLSEVR